MEQIFQPEKEFFVDNRELKAGRMASKREREANSDGIGYRASPDLDDKAEK